MHRLLDRIEKRMSSCRFTLGSNEVPVQRRGHQCRRGDPGYQKEACSYKRPEEDSRPRSIRRGSGNLKDHTVDVIGRGLLIRARTDKQEVSPRALEVRPDDPVKPRRRQDEDSSKTEGVEAGWAMGRAVRASRAPARGPPTSPHAKIPSSPVSDEDPNYEGLRGTWSARARWGICP